MAFTQKRVAGPVTLANIATMETAPGAASYAPGSGVTTIIKQIMFTNITSSTQQVSMWVFSGSGSIANSDMVFHSLDLAAYETMLINLSLVMVDGDAIYAGAGNASSVNLTVSGIEET